MVSATEFAGDRHLRWRATFAAIAAISVVGIAIGFGLPLLSVILETRGHSATAIGANTAIAGIASLAVAPFATQVAHRFGVIRVLLAMLAVGALSCLGFYLAERFWLWFPLRFSLHAALTMLFILSEFWIVESVPQKRRGFFLGLYATILSLGFAIGPLLFSITGSAGFLPFGVIIALIVAAAIPIIFARKDPPRMDEDTNTGKSFISFIFAVPAATAAVFVFGAVETGGFSLLPVYGIRIGYSDADAALLLTAIGLGNVCLQIPIGMLSDRVNDRRILLLACAAIGLAGSLLLPSLTGNWPATAIMFFVWGAVVAGLYTVGLAHLAARLKGRDLASANSAFVFCYALGMLAGPQAIGTLMDLNGANGFGQALTIFFAAYIAVGVARFSISRRQP
jgi:MFS family permease